MRAAWYTKQGAARDVLEVGELPDPGAGPGEVLVCVGASGVNPSDVKMRQGLRGPMPFPRVVPHSDGAGIVEAVGAGVDRSRVGERVWLWNGQWRRPLGTAAEKIALPAVQAVRLPTSTSFVEGACLGIPAMTAHRAVFSDGPVDGQTILVTGGAGAVGFYAIQLAKWGGATVITTVSSEEKAAHARGGGADHVVDYKKEDVAARVRELTAGRAADRIVEVDFGGNLAASRTALRQNGVIAAYASMGNLEPALPAYPLMAMNATLRFLIVYEMPDTAKAEACADIIRWLETGTARHAIARRFALDDIAAAHEEVETGKKIGQVIVSISNELA